MNIHLPLIIHLQFNFKAAQFVGLCKPFLFFLHPPAIWPLSGIYDTKQPRASYVASQTKAPIYLVIIMEAQTH